MILYDFYDFLIFDDDRFSLKTYQNEWRQASSSSKTDSSQNFGQDTLNESSGGHY